MCCQLCFFRESPLFCGQGSVTDLVRQSYLDHIPDPGCGERSVDSHGCVVLPRQRADESLIWNRIHRALRQHAQHVPRVPLG